MTTTLKLIDDKENKFDTVKTFELKSFPMCVNTGNKLMKIDDFLKIPTFPTNRDVESRAKKQVALLTKPMHKHVEVDLLKYTGPTVTVPALFQHGEEYCLDANTRQYNWKKHYTDKQVVNPQTTCIPVPKEVLVRTYEINDPYEAIELYNIIDSIDAVETKSDKVTGAFRAKNLLGNFTNAKIKNGQIGGALRVACPYGNKVSYKTEGVNNLFDQVEKVRDALVGMDKKDAPGKGHFHVQPAIGMALLAGTAMDCDNTWLDAVEKLRSSKVKDLIKIGEKLEDSPNTAINALIKGNICNPLVPMVHNALPYDIGYGQNPMVVLNYLAYCWQCIINDEKPEETITEQTIRNCYLALLIQAWGEVKE
jgi:hypothetical protein|tara:strand:- start:123 stop:1217 length:1095 start_codon:yes stop_codon:yes gene_type:complete